MYPDLTAPTGAVYPWSTLFSSILESINNVKQLFAADDLSRYLHFFVWALRVYHITLRMDLVILDRLSF